MNPKAAGAIGAVGLIVVVVAAEGRQNGREEWRMPAVAPIEISVATGDFIALETGRPTVARFTYVGPPARRFTNEPAVLADLGPVVQPSS